MKIAIFLGLVLVLIVGIIGIIAPRDFKMRRDIVINRPVSDVFNHLRILENHEKFSAWAKQDPDLKTDYSGPKEGVGAKASWDSQNPEVGTASQEIISVEENKRINTMIYFKKPFEADFLSYLTTEDLGDGKTKVSMGMEDEMPFPMYIISYVVNVCFKQQEKMNARTDESLNNLKNQLEQ